MTNTYVVSGTLTDPQTLRLSEPLPVRAGEVRVTVEVVTFPATERMTHVEFMDDLRRRREAGEIPTMTADEIDACATVVKAGRGN
ncbi:MAG: hypothetical protein ACRC7O_16320 [Fimbriiglobus sp.]